MLKLVEKIRNRQTSDRADAIFVASVIFIPFMFIMSGFAMDITKAVYVKQQYQIMGQEATSAAARAIDPDGSIRPDAPQIMVNTYRDRFTGSDSDSVNASYGGDTLEGTAGVRNSNCRTVEVDTNGDGDGDTVFNAPYMTITLDGGRNDIAGINGTPIAATWTSEGYGAPVQKTGTTYDQNVRYYSMSATIWDTAPNLILGMFGSPCQVVKTEVSSVTFGSQEDLDDFTDTGEDGNSCPSSNLTWGGEQTLKWSVMAGATSYKLVKDNVDPNASGFTTTDVQYSSSSLNKNASGVTWYLNIKRGTGVWESCGQIATTGATVATCPTISVSKGSDSTSPYDYVFTWSPRAGSSHSIAVKARNLVTGAVTDPGVVPESAGTKTASVTAAANEEIEFTAQSILGSSTVDCAVNPNRETPNVQVNPTCPTGFTPNYTQAATSGRTPININYSWSYVAPNDSLTLTVKTYDNNYTVIDTQVYNVSESSNSKTVTVNAGPSDYVSSTLTMVNSSGNTQTCGNRTIYPNRGTVAMPSCPSNISLSLTGTERTGTTSSGSIRYYFRITWTPRSGSANYIMDNNTRVQPNHGGGAGGGGGSVFEAKGSMNTEYALFFSSSTNKPGPGTFSTDVLSGDPSGSISALANCGTKSVSVPGY